MKKRLLAAALSVVMIVSLFAVVSFAAGTTTVAYDASAQYGWTNYLNLVNTIPDASGDPNGDYAAMRADGTPYKTVLNAVVAVMTEPGPGTGADGTYMNAYPCGDTNLYEYTQNVWGATYYMLAAGKQLAYDAWNTKLDAAVAVTYDAAGYTYVNADAQTVYDAAAYKDALKVFNEYLAYANDNWVFNADTTTRYANQLNRWNTLNAKLDALTPLATAPDLSGATATDARLNFWIGAYNCIDVAEYRQLPEVIAWGEGLQAAIAADVQGEANVDNYVMPNGATICGYWEGTVRNVVPMNNGLRKMADAIYNDLTLWPAGTQDAAAYADPAAVTAVFNDWADIRDVLRNSFTSPVSANLARLDALKASIQALEVKSTTPDPDPEPTPDFVDLSGYTSTDARLQFWITTYNCIDVHEYQILPEVIAWGTGLKKAVDDGVVFPGQYDADNYVMPNGDTICGYWEGTVRHLVPMANGLRAMADAIWNDPAILPAGSNDSEFYTDAAAWQAAYDEWVRIRDVLKNDYTSPVSSHLATLDAFKAQVMALPTDVVSLGGLTAVPQEWQLWVQIYNLIDVPAYMRDPATFAFGTAIKNSIANGVAFADARVDFEGTQYTVDAFWEQVVRFRVNIGQGLRKGAEKVLNDATLWPLGAVLVDWNQVAYDTVQYNAMLNFYVELHDYDPSNPNNRQAKWLEYTSSQNDAALVQLADMIRGLTPVSRPYDEAQLAAINNLKYYLPFYQPRIDRITLAENKLLPEYIEYKSALDLAAEYVALDWTAVTGDPATYPTAAQIYDVCAKDANGGRLENGWYALREKTGVDARGWDVLVYGKLNEYKASGLYTDESLAEVEDAYWYWARLYRDDRNNTDAMAKEALDDMASLLVLKPVPEPTNPLAFKGATLALQSSISIDFKVDALALNEYTNIYVVFDNGGVLTTVTDYTVASSSKGDRLVFRFNGLKPSQLGDDITATVHGTFEGKDYTAVATYGVHTYVRNMLNKTAGNTAYAPLRTLLVDLMNYGAASQVYANYKPTDLANAMLTAEELAEGTTAAPALTSITNPAYKTIAAPSVALKGAGLHLEKAVTIRFQIEATDITGLTAKIEAAGRTWEIPADKFAATGRPNRYYVYFDGLDAGYMSENVMFTIYRDGVAVSNTLLYSIESYAAGHQADGNALADLVVAMMKYGNAAKAYAG